jgi:Ser/Thr protein kinase RdoA (MazF antagonist)
MSRVPIIDVETLGRVLARYDLGGAVHVLGPGGGTANANLVIQAPRGRFFVRRRNPRYSSPEQVAYDHALMRHLAAKGIGGPLPIETRDGQTFARDGADVYEVQRLVEGTPFDPESPEQLRAAGEGLAAFHTALDDFAPPVPKNLPRYDHPRDIRAGFESLLPLATAVGAALVAAQGQPRGLPLHPGPAGQRDQIEAVLAVVDRLEAEFPDLLYDSLPHCVIHGDYHPANVLFRGNRLAGIFDLDWVSRQPRVRDLSDGIYYFAGRRADRLDGSDIRSLTRGLRYDIPRARVFLDAYRAHRPVAESELRVLPLVATARWLFAKVAGMRKVGEGERVAFALRDALAPVDWLARHGAEFIDALA